MRKIAAKKKATAILLSSLTLSIAFNDANNVDDVGGAMLNRKRS